MARQAIENIFFRVLGDNWKDISKRQFAARNTILHGGSVTSIESKTKMGIEDLVNELGTITWHAIMETITIPEDKTLNLGHRDWCFSNKNMVVSVLGRFEHDSDKPHPEEQKIPSVQARMHTRFDKGS